MVIIGPLISPEEGLVKKLENVRMKINQIQMNTGTLYITEKYEIISDSDLCFKFVYWIFNEFSYISVICVGKRRGAMKEFQYHGNKCHCMQFPANRSNAFMWCWTRLSIIHRQMDMVMVMIEWTKVTTTTTTRATVKVCSIFHSFPKGKIKFLWFNLSMFHDFM